MQTLERSITINASPESVWQVLTDFKAYPEWNPFILSIRGEAREGARLQVVMELEGGKKSSFSPVIRAFIEPKEFRWLGHMMIPGVFDGEHIFLIRAEDDGTSTLVQRENFKGFLAKPVLKMIGEKVRTGFEEMNQALKMRVERKGSA